MTKELNSQCPYDIVEDEESQTYCFITQNGIEYKIAFQDGSPYFPQYSVTHSLGIAFLLNIENVNGSYAPIDRRVRLTIEKIVNRFF